MKPSKYRQQKGYIFNIQRFSIHDGPGIRSTVFLKGCPLRCFWCQNPESQKQAPEIFFNYHDCGLCGECVALCPAGASAIVQNSVAIDRDKCIGCGQCAAVCPNGARTLVGKLVTAGEVTDEVIRDKNFYKNSGGGVTLSGGEPLFQPEFLLAILAECKNEGLHTALDTTGYASWPTIEKILPFTDLVLFDIKCIDPHKHYQATGKANSLILENAQKIAKIKPMRVRVPLIPGFNDSQEEIRSIVNFVKLHLSVPIDLLPYNRLADSKYERMGRKPSKLQDISEDLFHELGLIIL